MSSFDRIKRINDIDKEIRLVTIIELLSLWEEKKEYDVFNILFKRYLIEEDNEVLDTIANGLKEINPLKAAVNIQELYEKEHIGFKKLVLIDLLTRIKSHQIEHYILKFLSNETDSKVADHLRASYEKFQKSIIDAQDTSSSIVYWKEIEYDETYEDKCCMICKLHFTKFDGIVSCSICQALFHTEHLIDWLAEKKQCPVCNRKVVDIGLKKFR
ncbi:MAG: hypothetical protein FK733_17440 [Asgard group archaeon]|nr:hypothetical protein [Asgard group archaeon]